MISLQKAAWMAGHPRQAVRELKFARKLGRSVPSFGDTPWLDPLDIETLDGLLDPQRAMIEYGAGSSTPYFARRCLAMHSVDSSPRYVAAVQAEAARRGAANVRLSTIDLGLLRDWGWPIDDYPTATNVRKWRRYLAAPWETLGETPVSVILVDGRFRVACAAYALGRVLQRGEAGVTVFLDDFVGREAHYDCLAEIAEIVRTPGRGVIVKPRVTDSATIDAFVDRWIRDPN